MKTRIPALVVGGDINGLGVTRSLARSDIPVIVADTNPDAPAMRSRHARKRVLRSLTGEALIADLLAIAKAQDERPVLFLTQENSVFAALDHHQALTEAFRVSLPAPEVMRPLLHKPDFQVMAESLGFRVPRSVQLSGPSDLESAEALCFPCVLKPAYRHDEYGKRFKKAYRVADMAELRALYQNIWTVLPDMVVQEWVEGGDDCLYFCLQYLDSAHRPLASFVGQKLRAWPPLVGGTASCMPAPEDFAHLAQITADFFRLTGFFGMGSMEFKRDARSGEFFLIEPTVGRTDFQEEVATLNGVNLPLAAYCHETGLIYSAPQRTGQVGWSVSPIDRWSAELQPNGSDWPPGLRVLDAQWRLGDPLPWCFSAMSRLSQRWKTN